MRLLTAGSLVRVQQGEPKRAGRHQSFCSFLLYLLTPTNYSATHSRAAVNWLGAPRCLRQMKRCSEQEETTSIASAPSEQGDYVSDRQGRWFESNRGSHLRSLEPQRVQGFSLNVKKDLYDHFNLPTFLLGEEAQMMDLTNEIISYFSQES